MSNDQMTNEKTNEKMKINPYSPPLTEPNWSLDIFHWSFVSLVICFICPSIHRNNRHMW